MAASRVPTYSIWDEMPNAPGQISSFSGRACLPLSLGMNYFRKCICVAGEDEELFGRVEQNNVIANRVYPGPLYFKAQVGTGLIPCTIMYSVPLIFFSHLTSYYCRCSVC